MLVSLKTLRSQRAPALGAAGRGQGGQRAVPPTPQGRASAPATSTFSFPARQHWLNWSDGAAEQRAAKARAVPAPTTPDAVPPGTHPAPSAQPAARGGLGDPRPGLKTHVACPESGARPAVTVSLRSWGCPEPHSSPALQPASPSAWVMAYLGVSICTHSHTMVLPRHTGSVGQQM